MVFDGLRRLRREWQGLRAFQALPRAERQLVFYSEGAGYWTYFEPVFRALRSEYEQPVLYVTSAEQDPAYRDPPAGLRAFYVGLGTVRTAFFASLDADVLVMTMPDLHTMHIKRSPHPVHYCYLNHSMVSTHMVYRPAAFDHFDSMLCVGPHHIEEIRKREALHKLPAKQLFEHGYGRLDTILAHSHTGPLARAPGQPGQILVAPSWGANSLLELHGAAAIQPFIDAGFRVVLRPHPQTRRLNPRVIDEIVSRYAGEARFSVDENGDAHASLAESDIMVSDWSGAALEFAFGLERPVIFVDVPRKVLDPDYESLGIEPLEARIRSEIGAVVAPPDLASLGGIAQGMMADIGNWQLATRAARERWIFNVGRSGSAGAECLMSLLRRTSTPLQQGARPA
ncbi:MAG: CDP-glycerol glycerophosphotransferase family protein [Burkholderiaceae bacterium]|nr:CDP-glycerol glycerophosphotransferase family protein [Burkholderiaceae bacterium]